LSPCILLFGGLDVSSTVATEPSPERLNKN
jgi:hypothetical protein